MAAMASAFTRLSVCVVSGSVTTTLSADAKTVLTGLVDVFNLWLKEGLTGLPVKLVDANTSFKDVYANPGKYGYGVDRVPEMARKMTEALATGQGDHTSPTVKAVTKAMGIKPTGKEWSVARNILIADIEMAYYVVTQHHDSL